MLGKINPDHTLHDRQDIIVDGPITTMSTTFVDIPGAQLVTGDLGEPGNYQFWVSISVENSNNNTSVNFRAVVNGVPGRVRTVDFGPGAANDPQHATLIGQANDIVADTHVVLQWSVSSGTGQIDDLAIMFDGVVDERVLFIPSIGVDSYLLEDGFALLKEDGDFLLIE